MAPFLVNPYDQTFDLTKKEHLKLFMDGCEGLEKDLRFDGKKENYDNFVKLIEKKMRRTRVIDALEVAISWDNSGTAPEDADEVIDLFTSNGATKEQVSTHCDIVWNTEDHTHPSSEFNFCRATTKPTTTAGLDKLRNCFKLKHAMLGNMIWNSLTADYQLEIGGESSIDNFQRDNEFDGVELWYYIQKQVNPSTTTGAANLKDEIENANLKDFKYNIKEFNVWFANKRTAIIKEEGKELYNEYTRNIFKAYLTAKNQEFLEDIKDKKRKWRQGRVKADYDHTNVMEVALSSYNDIDADSKWGEGKSINPSSSSNNASKTTPKTEDAKFLALAAQICELKQSLAGKNTGNSNTGDSNNGNGGGKKKKLTGWRYKNPDGLTEMTREGKTYKWCNKDCHPAEQWCDRPVCRNRADYKKFLEEKRKNESGDAATVKTSSTSGFSNDFKVALAAITTPDDYKTLESQFFGKAGN